MPEKQLAIVRIENLDVEKLTKALTNVGATYSKVIFLNVQLFIICSMVCKKRL